MSSDSHNGNVSGNGSKTQKALIASELRYRRLFESAKDGILILDAETGMIVDVNPFLVDLLGYSHEMFCGKKIWELGFFKDILANKDNFAELQAKEYIRYENLPLETSNGRRIEVEFVSNVYRANGHEVIQCNIRDNTEHHRAEKVSRQLAAIVAYSEDAIFGKDLNGIITSWNRGAEKIFGYTAGEMVGTSITRLIPADRPNEETEILDKIKRGETVEHFETVRLTRSGALIDVAVTASPIRDATGMIRGVSKVVRNISERKQAERMLEESERKYRSLFESSNDAIMTLEPPLWRFSAANPATVKMFNAKSEEDLLSYAPWELSPERQPDGLYSTEGAKKIIEKVLGEGSHFFEWTHRRIGGDEFPASVLLSRVRIGAKVCLQATVRDMTEHNRAEAVTRKLLAIIEASPDLIGLASLEGSIEYLNPEGKKLVGLDQKDSVSSTKILDYVHETDRERFQNQVMPALFRRHLGR